MNVHVDQVFLLRESRDVTPVSLSLALALSIARAAISYVTIVILECDGRRRFAAVLSESVAAGAFRERSYGASEL